MQKIILTALIAFGFSFGIAGFAQDTNTETAETNEQGETTNTEDQTFPVAGAQNQDAQSELVKEEHGDWQIICFNVGETEENQCRMYQLLTNADGAAVAELNVINLENAAQAAAGVNFITPLGTLLTAQAGMRIDEGPVKRYPFGWCEQSGCISRFGLTEEELDELKKGNKAYMTLTAFNAPQNPITLEVSLKGFTAGWDALNAK